MSNRVLIKKRGSDTNAPSVHSSDPDNNGDLKVGELALNYRDGKIYYAKYDGSSYSAAYFGDSTQSATVDDATALAIALG